MKWTRLVAAGCALLLALLPVTSAALAETPTGLPGAASQPPDKVPYAAAWVVTACLIAADPGTGEAVRGALKGPAGDAAFPVITQLGETPGVAAALGALYLSGDRETAGEAATAVLWAGVLAQGTKWAVGRGRPDSDAPNSVHYLGGRPGYDSFPSGHTATAFALARVLAKRYPARKGLFYTVAGLVGLSRVYLNRHYPGDVAARGISSQVCP